MGDGTREVGMRYWVMVGGAALHPAVEPTLVEYCPKLHTPVTEEPPTQ